MFTRRLSPLIGPLTLRGAPVRHFSAREVPSESITSTWSLKLDLGDDSKNSSISVNSIINELIREWLGPRRKKERARYYQFIRAKSTGREVDADGFLFKPGERLSAPGYLIRGIVYELSSLSLGANNLDTLVEKGVVPKELLPPSPDVEPETLGLEDLLTDQSGGSRLGTTTTLKDGREALTSASLKSSLDFQGAGVTRSLKDIGRGTELPAERRRETESDLIDSLEARRVSGSSASTRESSQSRSGTTSSILDMAAALDDLKGVVPNKDDGPASGKDGLSRQSSDITKAVSQATRHSPAEAKGSGSDVEETSAESAGPSTWLTSALDEQKPVRKPDVDLDKTIRNKYENKLRSIREKAAVRKQEGKAIDERSFDISKAEKVGWKGGAIAVPGIVHAKRWRVLPGAGELLAHLKERGLQQGLFVAASDKEKDETLEQLRDFKFSPMEEVKDSPGAASISPDTFRCICDQWGLPPKQVLVVVGPGPIGKSILKAVANSGCYLCQMTPYGVTPPLSSLEDDVIEAPDTSREVTPPSKPVSRLKQWLGIDDENMNAPVIRSRGKPRPHFLVEDVPGLKAVVEDLNGVSYRRSTFMRGLGSGRERAAAAADNERVFV